MGSSNSTENLKKAGDGIAHAAREGAARGSSELRHFFDDVEDLLGRISDVGNDDVQRLKTKVADSLDSARGTVSRGAARLRERAVDAAGTADDYAREQPWTVVGIAAVVGLALGAALASRR
jgi:ElaB/YqjD/DUF883 family membrane-anchored ribosome-binding protein